MGTVSDDFSRADSATMGHAPADWSELTGGLHYTPSRRHEIRETCATIQQVALTIAIPVFAVLGAILLVGLIRVIWTV